MSVLNLTYASPVLRHPIRRHILPSLIDRALSHTLYDSIPECSLRPESAHFLVRIDPPAPRLSAKAYLHLWRQHFSEFREDTLIPFFQYICSVTSSSSLAHVREMVALEKIKFRG